VTDAGIARVARRSRARHVTSAAVVGSLLLFVAALAASACSKGRVDDVWFTFPDTRLWRLMSGGGHVQIATFSAWPTAERLRWRSAAGGSKRWFPQFPSLTNDPTGQQTYTTWHGTDGRKGMRGQIRLHHRSDRVPPLPGAWDGYADGNGGLARPTRLGSFYMTTVSWGLVVGATAILAVASLSGALVARLVRNTRRRRLARSGRCPECGYDLRGTPDRCPECGTAPRWTSRERGLPALGVG